MTWILYKKEIVRVSHLARIGPIASDVGPQTRDKKKKKMGKTNRQVKLRVSIGSLSISDVLIIMYLTLLSDESPGRSYDITHVTIEVIVINFQM